MDNIERTQRNDRLTSRLRFILVKKVGRYFIIARTYKLYSSGIMLSPTNLDYTVDIRSSSRVSRDENHKKGSRK